MLWEMHEAAWMFYFEQRQAARTDPTSAPAQALAQRGLREAITGVARVGYAPAWTALTDSLRAAGYTDAQLLDSGLGLRTSRGTVVDRFRDRVMFPVTDSPSSEPGAVVGFIGRSLQPDAGADGAPPKYLNSPDTAIYRKGEHLYGLDMLPLSPQAVPVLVEGPWDALAVNAAGDGNYVGLATGGTALTAAQVADLDTHVNLAVRGVVTGFDDDAAGRQAALAAYPLLRAADAWPTSAPGLPGHDPARLYAEAGPDVLRQSLDAAASRPLANRVLEDRLTRWASRLDTAEGQVGAAQSVAGLLLGVPDEHRGTLLVRATGHHGLSPDTVFYAYTRPSTPSRTAP